MRTTLDIDDDGCGLARSGAKAGPASVSQWGFHTFALSTPAQRFGLAEVNAALEAEDREFLKTPFGRR
jgi:hypothetical protein